MKITILTLLAGLSLSVISAYFSIIGLLIIFPTSFWPILAMGVSLEAAKVIAILWLKQNWSTPSIFVRTYLLISVLVLMSITSIGTYGFLSKAHIEQGASTVDNTPKIVQFGDQIDRMKAQVADDEKIIKQLDSTVDSYLGKDRTDKSLAVRKSQVPQRKQLRNDIDEIQKRIDDLTNQKFQLESAVRKVQLDVGPIRYIAELFYGVADDATQNIESAVRLFTLLIVLSLDPFAISLLMASNNTMLRMKDEKEEALYVQQVSESPRTSQAQEETDTGTEEGYHKGGLVATDNGCGSTIYPEILQEFTPAAENTLIEEPDEMWPVSNYFDIHSTYHEKEKTTVPETKEIIQKSIAPISTGYSNNSIVYRPRTDIYKSERDISEKFVDKALAITESSKSMQETIRQALNEKENSILENTGAVATANTAKPFVSESHIPGAEDESDINPSATEKEVPVVNLHFIPQKMMEISVTDSIIELSEPVVQKDSDLAIINNKYPRALSWLSEFKRTLNG